MFVEETIWIRDVLDSSLPDEKIDVLDVGSSNLEFRTIIQPHIYKNIHKPLIERGCSITYADIKDDEGVDVVVDLTEQNLPQSLFDKKYDLVICCNILEHVDDRAVFLQNLARFVKKGGSLLVTVPRRYPKHSDPIDTMYRPTPDELLKFIGKFMKIRQTRQAVLSIHQREYYTRTPGRVLAYLTLRPLWYIWRYYLKIFLWQATCVLVEVEDVY